MGAHSRKTPSNGATALRRIAMLGNHLPRQCGIATFTTDLSEAVAGAYPGLDCFVVAMNDAHGGYEYPSRVQFEIAATDPAAYRCAADFLNVGAVDLVSVQHEYGIFGGKAGSHVLSMLRELHMPIVTTLHTILREPDALQRSVMDELTKLSERVVVMSARGADVVRDVHHVPEHKIDVIPHGIPVLPDAGQSKRRLGVQARTVLLTFGLLSPDKGIEHVIDALPAIAGRHPDVLYVVLGVTHPHIKERYGETYRGMLEHRARALGVQAHVMFHNRFVDREELVEFLSAADIYITPYLKSQQSTSGTLAYAVGSGKVAVSTPYLYASELLADGRGALVPWPHDDPAGIGRAVIALLDDDDARSEICARAGAYAGEMRWPAVARAYVQSFERALAARPTRIASGFRAETLTERPIGLPEVNLKHVRALTDGTGMLQHARYDIPRRDHGYCVDDNARALLLTSLLEDARTEHVSTARDLAPRYLAFLNHAFDTQTGRFKNFMTYSRHWVDNPGSDDSHGRALWGLGSVVGRCPEGGRRSLAEDLFVGGLPQVERCTSPRAWAYALLGIDEVLRARADDRPLLAACERLAERLFDLYRGASSPDWPWFEQRATYCNARLSQALVLGGAQLEHDGMVDAGLQSLRWLAQVQRSASGESWFAPIGTDGFHERGGSKAAFDQQPVEAAAMVAACLSAHRITGNEEWSRQARRAFHWFVGDNDLGQSLYDPATGGCRDGLHADRPNDNQGAESTLSFQLALVEMRIAAHTRVADPAEMPPRPVARSARQLMEAE